MLPRSLQTRKLELERALSGLCGSVEIIPTTSILTANGEVLIEFRHSARIKQAGLRLYLREEFRDINTASGSMPRPQRLRLRKEFRQVDTDPQLYSFSYHVAEDSDVEFHSTLFRYECHPDVGDRPQSHDSNDETVPFRSPYERHPHFHPDRTTIPKIRKLHFPFHREERKGVAFALIEWLRVDLIRRFYGQSS